MNFTRANFSEIYNSRRQDLNTKAFSTESYAEFTAKYYDGVGFHLYSQLSLQLKYTAPQNASDAAKSFEIIQRYTDIADACAQNFDGRILEVQGECLHFFFEKPLTQSTLSEILVFCSAFTNSVYEQQKHLGDAEFEGFKTAFDHGRAIILSTGTSADDSLVSLGPCANHPAKYLGEVPAGFTSMPKDIARILFSVDERKNWHSINLKERDAIKLSSNERLNIQKFSATANHVIQSVYDSAKFFVKINRATDDKSFNFSSATLQQGFFMRADLDGFTKKVQAAFDYGSGSAIAKLLTDFLNVLEYGNQFIDKTKRPVIRLPWAGDCANILLLPKTNEGIDDAQLYYSARGPADWLTGYNNAIKPPFDNAKWLVSICCGNKDDGNRNVLLAQVKTTDHNFLFATGWSVGRSQDAHKINGSKAGDALTSKIDYDALDHDYKDYFHEASSVFMRSETLSKCVLTEQAHVPFLTTQPRNVAGVTAPIPNPRPYWCEKH